MARKEVEEIRTESRDIKRHFQYNVGREDDPIPQPGTPGKVSGR